MHHAVVLRDDRGRLWMWKPVRDGDEFLAFAEHASHVIGRRLGLEVAKSRLVHVEGSFGQAQRLYDGAMRVPRPELLTASQAVDVLHSHVFNWLISNQDTAPRNFIVLPDSRIIGVDKGKAWKRVGADRLRQPFSGSEGASYYAFFWRAVDRGVLSLDLSAADHLLTAISAFSESDYREIVSPYVEGLVQSRGVDGERLMELIVDRKRSTPREWEHFLSERGRISRATS